MPLEAEGDAGAPRRATGGGSEAADVVVLSIRDAVASSEALAGLIEDGQTRGFVPASSVRKASTAFDLPEQAYSDMVRGIRKAGLSIVDDEDRDDEKAKKPAGMTTDGVRQYLNEIGRVTLLTAAEEVNLAKRIEAGRVAGAVIDSPIHITPGTRARLRMVERDGERAKRALIEANLRLVVSVAKRYLGSGMPMSDLVQEGNLGLMRAVDKFDATRGYKFSTYATWWIRQMISRAIADQSRTIRLPVHLFETVNRVKRTERALSQQLGHDPSVEELAAACDLPVERVLQLKKFGVDPTSLDTPIGTDGDASIGDLIEDGTAEVPVEVAAMALLQDQLSEILHELTDREREVLERRFGLNGRTPETLEQVGVALELTRERIRQIEGKALSKLRHPQRADRLEGYLHD